MKKFNLKKSAATTIKPTEKMLRDSNENMGLGEVEVPVVSEKMLEDVRKAENEYLSVEKRMNDVRSENSPNKVTEKQLNDKKDGWLKTRRDDAIPLMDMAKSQEKDEKQASVKDRDTDFWDKYVGMQLEDGQKTTIVDNTQNSQLLSNYKTREQFEKKNPSIKEASIEQLKDADAMLYHIYRQAAAEGRNLSDREVQIVNDINSGKIRVLSQTQFDQEVDEDFRADQAQMQGDAAEQQMEEIDDEGKPLYKPQPNDESFLMED